MESDVYPDPSLDNIEILPIPAELVTRTEVAAAPTPNVLNQYLQLLTSTLIVIVGATVYPEPGLISNISLTENTSATDVVIATAVAFVPPAGAGVIETVGVFVYPNPSFVSSIFLTYPETVLTPKLAVDPETP